MRLGRRICAAVVLASPMFPGGTPATAQSGGSQLTGAVHISLAPTCTDATGLGLIPDHPYSSPYDDLRLKR